MSRFIYADNAATTRLSKQALDAMLPYLSEKYGNPSSIYSIGREAREAVSGARETIAGVFGADPAGIFFTGSGTEADNWAIKGVAAVNSHRGKHIISSKIEHHAVLHSLMALEEQGFDVTYLDVDRFGMVSPGDVEKAIRPDTILITVMTANNEIGTIQPIAEIGAVAKARKIYFHTDAVQAAGHLPINVDELNIDFMSVSAHKFNGPKGVGVLYARKGARFGTFMHGGGQESGRRASTENVAGIVGMAAALQNAAARMDENEAHLRKLSDTLRDELLKIPYTRLNGHPAERLANNVNVSFEFIEGEGLLLMLDMAGICASSGSACTSGSLDPSHVLLAIGLPHEVAHGSLRLSLAPENTPDDVRYMVENIRRIVDRLRQMSPLYETVSKA